MATMNVSLPDRMKDWVESRTQGGKYSNASDYVRRDQERQEDIAQLQRLITEGTESGKGERSMEDLLKKARRRIGSAGDKDRK